MNRLEALEILGLQDTSSREEIEKTYRDAIKVAHPDQGGDANGAIIALLTKARDVALSELPPAGTELAVKQVAQVVLAEQQHAAEARAATDRAVKSVVMHHVGALSFRRRQSASFAALSAGTAAFLVLIQFLLDKDAYDYELYASLLTSAAVLLGLFAAFLGIWSWRIGLSRQALEFELEDAADTLSDRAAVSDTLSEIGLGAFFTRAELHARLEIWDADENLHGPKHTRVSLLGPVYKSVPLAFTAQRIGPVDFGKLLLAKGLELGLLEDAEVADEEGQLQYGYSRV